MRASNSGGFSLLELMVVVALVGLAAAMIVPNLVGPGGDSLADAGDRVRGRLAALSDRSLVRGELLAVRLQQHGLQFLRYEYREGKFLPLGEQGDGGVQLAEPLYLEWRLAENEEGPDLEEVVKSRLTDETDGATGEKEAGADGDDQASAGERDDEEDFPQIFFFPSGEATPVTLWIRDADTESDIMLELDSLGRVERAERKEDSGA